jgi:hypothetical protein
MLLNFWTMESQFFSRRIYYFDVNVGSLTPNSRNFTMFSNSTINVHVSYEKKIFASPDSEQDELIESIVTTSSRIIDELGRVVSDSKVVENKGSYEKAEVALSSAKTTWINKGAVIGEKSVAIAGKQIISEGRIQAPEISLRAERIELLAGTILKGGLITFEADELIIGDIKIAGRVCIESCNRIELSSVEPHIAAAWKAAAPEGCVVICAEPKLEAQEEVRVDINNDAEVEKEAENQLEGQASVEEEVEVAVREEPSLSTNLDQDAEVEKEAENQLEEQAPPEEEMDVALEEEGSAHVSQEETLNTIVADNPASKEIAEEVSQKVVPLEEGVEPVSVDAPVAQEVEASCGNTSPREEVVIEEMEHNIESIETIDAQEAAEEVNEEKAEETNEVADSADLIPIKPEFDIEFTFPPENRA